MNGWMFSAKPNRYELHADLTRRRPRRFDWQIGSTQYLDDIAPGQVMALNQVGGARSGALLGHGIVRDYPVEDTVTASWLAPAGHWLDPADLGRTLWFVEFDFTWLPSPIPYLILKGDPDFGRSLFIRSSGRSNPTPMDPRDVAALFDVITRFQGPRPGGRSRGCP